MNNLFKLVQTLGKNIGNELPIRQLSFEAKVPYTTAHRLIKKNNIFQINKKGNIKLVSLNTNNEISKHYLIISERMTVKEYVQKEPAIRILRNDLPKGKYSVLLFGSRAEGSHRKKSDVDLCIINKKGERNVRFSKIELVYKLEVNPIYFSESEFKKMLKENEHNVAKEIIKKHIILHGEEYFWNIVWKNGISKRAL